MNNQNKSPRKAYSKPMIAVEEFTFNQFIASCAVKTRNNANWKNDLMAYSPLIYTQVEAGNLFIADLQCFNHVDSDAGKEDMDTLCYHTSTSPLFTS